MLENKLFGIKKSVLCDGIIMTLRKVFYAHTSATFISY